MTKELTIPKDPSVDLSAVMDVFEKAKSEGWNVLIPQTLIAGLADNYAVVVAQTIISTDVNDGEIYPDDNTAEEIDGKSNENKKYRLHKTALMRIAGPYGAGIKWWPKESGIEKIDRDYIAFKAVGSIMAPDGQEIPLIGHDDLDFIVLAEKYQESYTAKVQKMKKDDGKGGKRFYTDQEKKEYIAYCVNRDLSQKREHKLAIVETGAMERVIRAAIGLKNSYTLKQLRKPFITARIIFRPDYSNSDLRKTALDAGTEAAKKIFNIDTKTEGKTEGKTSETPPPSDESRLVDFQNCDATGQNKAITNLSQDVKYDLNGYLSRSQVKTLDDLKAENRLGLFKHLLSLAPKEQTTFAPY